MFTYFPDYFSSSRESHWPAPGRPLTGPLQGPGPPLAARWALADPWSLAGPWPVPGRSLAGPWPDPS